MVSGLSAAELEAGRGARRRAARGRWRRCCAASACSSPGSPSSSSPSARPRRVSATSLDTHKETLTDGGRRDRRRHGRGPPRRRAAGGLLGPGRRRAARRRVFSERRFQRPAVDARSVGGAGDGHGVRVRLDAVYRAGPRGGARRWPPPTGRRWPAGCCSCSPTRSAWGCRSCHRAGVRPADRRLRPGPSRAVGRPPGRRRRAGRLRHPPADRPARLAVQPVPDLLNHLGLERLTRAERRRRARGPGGRGPLGPLLGFGRPDPRSMAAKAMAPAVHLRAAVALAGRFPALSGVDLIVAPGEVVVVVGPNGAGKTSLLRTCAGLLAVTSGEASCSATTCGTTAPRCGSRSACSATRPRLYDELTAAENVRFARAGRPAGRPAGSTRALDRLGSDRPATADPGRPPLGRPAPASGAGGARRPRPEAVAARRAARRARRRRPGRCWPSWSPRPSPAVRRCSSRRTSRSWRCRWPTGWSPWSGGRVGDERRGGRRAPLARPVDHAGGDVDEDGGSRMWRDALLVAGKDLRIELRSRVALWQVLPFAAPRPRPLRLRARPWTDAPSRRPRPGCSGWPSCFSTVLATQRSFAIESGEGTRDGLRLSGIDPAGIFLGKAAAVARAAGRRSRSCCGPAMTLPLRRARVHSPGWPSWPRCWRPSAWPPPASSTARSRPACGCARPCCRCSSCPILAPVLLAGSRAWAAAIDRLGVGRRVVARGSSGPSPPSTSSSGSSSTARCRRPDEPRPPRPALVRAARDRRRGRSLAAHGLARPLGHAARPGAGQHSSGSLYLHPPVAWVALYLAFGLAALSSLLYLWRRTRSLFWDRLAAASVEVGVVFNALTLVDRLDLGPAHLGGLVDLDSPADQHRAAARALPRLPGPAPGAGRSRGAGQALRGGRAGRLRRRPDRALLGRSGGRRSTRARSC